MILCYDNVHCIPVDEQKEILWVIKENVQEKLIWAYEIVVLFSFKRYEVIMFNKLNKK